MRISRISMQNYKSYKSLDIALDRFNVFIGANAAGKSNLISSFKFLRDIVVDGLDNAISMLGGALFIKNINISDNSYPISFLVTFLPDKNFSFKKTINSKNYRMEIKEITYSFKFDISTSGGRARVIEDRMIQKFDAYTTGKNRAKTYIGSSEFDVFKKGSKFQFRFRKNAKIALTQEELECLFFIGHNEFIGGNKLLKEEQMRNLLMIETPLFFMPHIEIIKNDIRKITIYDFDPQKPKHATSIAGKAELEESGDNLAIVLKKILGHEDQKRKLMNLVHYALPFVEDLGVENLFDKYLQIVIREKYPSKSGIPAFLLSDGTIFILSIIIAIYFENKPISIFEEPERRLHPSLISKVIDMMKDASAHHQVLLSTHNPEIVKYAGIENILFISRDQEGFSSLTHLKEKKEIMTFLENEIGLDELFVQNLLDK